MALILKKGDKVRHKTSLEKMVVLNIETSDGKITCQWRENGKEIQEDFDPVMLEKVNGISNLPILY